MKPAYPPLGRCVYCGKVEPDLSKEHIIPFALGGNIVLREASCAAHRDVTSKAELAVARNMYELVRAQDGIQSRRKRPPVTVEVSGRGFDGQPMTVAVPASEYPRMRIGLTLDAPTLLSGALDVPDVFEPRVTLDEVGVQRVLQRYGFHTADFFSHPINVVALTTVVAKIAHVYAVAELIGARFEPVLLPLIDTAAPSWQMLRTFVGGFGADTQQSDTVLSWRREQAGGAAYAVVDLSLREFKFLPRFQVVAARLPA